MRKHLCKYHHQMFPWISICHLQFVEKALSVLKLFTVEKAFHRQCQCSTDIDARKTLDTVILLSLPPFFCVIGLVLWSNCLWSFPLSCFLNHCSCLCLCDYLFNLKVSHTIGFELTMDIDINDESFPLLHLFNSHSRMKGATAASFLSIAGGASESVTEGEIILSNSGRHGSIKYCAHGRMAQNCCQLEEIDDKSSASMNLKQSTANWSHCHSPDSSKTSDIDSSARRKLIIACVLCLLFMAAEAIGGWLANSLAIATDAAHLLTDLASFLISLFSLWLSSRPASKKFNFGWYRAEVVGALTSVLLIWVITGILVYLAIQRLITGEIKIEAEPMLITAGLGVLVNIM